MAATANRAEVLRVKESTWGVTPPNPAWISTRFTGESLNNSLTTEQSQEIRPDRTLADLSVVDASAGGSIDIEFSYGSFDDLIEAALMSTWTTVNITSAAGDISVVAAADDNLVSSTPGKFANVIVGQSIAISGFSDPGNNGLFKVVAKDDDETLTIFPQPSSAETASGSDVSLVGDVITNGILEQSFSIMRVFNDANPVARQLYRGMRVGSWTLDFSTGAMVTGAFNLLGRSAEWISAAPVGSTYVPASTTDVMNAVSNISDISLDGTPLCASGLVSNFTFELNNQHREQKGLCRLGAVGIVAGQLLVTISGSQYFVNDTEAKKFETSQAFSFSWSMMDNAGNQYVFHLPRNKYESFDVNATGLDSDVMAEMSAQALLDPVTGKVIIITRIPAPPVSSS